MKRISAIKKRISILTALIIEHELRILDWIESEDQYSGEIDRSMERIRYFSGKIAAFERQLNAAESLKKPKTESENSASDAGI